MRQRNTVNIEEIRELVLKNTKAALHLTLGTAYFQNKAYRKARIEYSKSIKALMNKAS
jgi:uncharacterized protein HemY